MEPEIYQQITSSLKPDYEYCSGLWYWFNSSKGQRYQNGVHLRQRAKAPGWL